MSIRRTAYHEAGHAVLALHVGWEVKGVTMQRHGDAVASVRQALPDGYGETPERLTHLAYGSSLSLAAGAGAELAAYGEFDPDGCADDLAKLKQLYHDERTLWRWARHADIFEGVMTCVAEQALVDDVEAWKGVAGLLHSRDAVGAYEIAMMGPFTTWMVGEGWQHRFWDLVDRANARLAVEVECLQERIAAKRQQREFATRHAQLQDAINARVPAAERTTWHPPRVYELMARWGR
jgi:hypothetical protein